MARLIRKKKIKNFIIFGNTKKRQVINAEYNAQKQMWDMHLMKENPEFLVILFMMAGGGALGYMAFNTIGALIGLVGGTVATVGTLAFFQPNMRPQKPITLPASAIPGLSTMNLLSSGIHYFYCPNYDDKGDRLPLENDMVAMAVAENVGLEEQIRLKNERIMNLEAQLTEMQTTYDNQLTKKITQLEQLSKASRPYATSQKPSPNLPEWIKEVESEGNG